MTLVILFRVDTLTNQVSDVLQQATISFHHLQNLSHIAVYHTPLPYNAYPPQYSHTSPSSGPSNSENNDACDVTHNTSTTLSLAYHLEDPPVSTLVRLTPRVKKCYGCGNIRSNGSTTSKIQRMTLLQVS